MLDPYSHIEQFEEKLSEWERARFLKERRLFRKMMNLILDPLKRSKETFPTLHEKDLYRVKERKPSVSLWNRDIVVF